MARRKETIWQNDFSLGEVRPEAEERDDIPLIASSCRRMKNMKNISTSQMEGRPGTIYISSTEAMKGVEVDLGNDRLYDMHIVPSGVVLYDVDDAVEFTGSLTWTGITGAHGSFDFDDIEFWVLSDPDASAIFIGSQNFPIQALTVDDDGIWSFGEMQFAEGLSGVIRQPYWRYYKSTTIQPSARTGAITITASDPIWKNGHNGMAIRYLDREIILGSKVSDTVINGTVTEQLPPTYDITVAAVDGYNVGDVVEHELLGGRGIITGIAGSIITVLATSNYDGFDNATTPKLVAPNAAQVISSVSLAASSAATFLWDMQMQSKVHGYAGYAGRHKGRTYLCGFPGAPQGVAASVAGTTTDFGEGPNDADGFVETVGTDSGGELRYIISAEDLLFLTTRGLYYQSTRGGEAVTPTTFGPVRFSRIGCAEVTPIAVDDGCVFIGATGQQVKAAILAGDIYKSWRVIDLAKYHSHLISRPIFIGATSSGSEVPEEFIYVVNNNGETAVCQWDREADIISWRAWETEGDFKAVYQCFGKTYAVVERMINGTTVQFRERFEEGLLLDCVAAVEISSMFPEGQSGQKFPQGVTAFATHLEGHTATVSMEDWDLGDHVINAAGKPVDENGDVINYPDYDGIAQIGLIFIKRVVPWSRRSVNTQRGTREVKRLVDFYITVRNSTTFEVNGVAKGGYRAGEDLTLPPQRRTEQFREAPVGESGFNRLPITQNRPGVLQILKFGYRVVI